MRSSARKKGGVKKKKAGTPSSHVPLKTLLKRKASLDKIVTERLKNPGKWK